MSNLRQVSQSLLMYADDNDDTLPPFHNVPPGGNETHWQQAVGVKYLNESGNSFTYSVADAEAVLRSTMHCPSDATKWAGWSRCVRNTAINGNSWPGGPQWPGPYGVCLRKLSSVQYPSELCLVGDGGSGVDTTEWGYAARLPGIVSTLPLSSFARHHGGMNFVMVDGHAEWHTGDWVNNEWVKEGVNNSRFWDWNADNNQ